MKLESLLLISIIGCILILVLKQYHKAFGVLVSVLICILVMGNLLPQIERIFQTARNIYEQSQMDSMYFSTLCKALGISYLTQMGIDICRDCGENALATSIELCGRIFMLLLSLPLFLTLTETVLEMMP